MTRDCVHIYICFAPSEQLSCNTTEECVPLEGIPFPYMGFTAVDTIPTVDEAVSSTKCAKVKHACCVQLVLRRQKWENIVQSRCVYHWLDSEVRKSCQLIISIHHSPCCQLTTHQCVQTLQFSSTQVHSGQPQIVRHMYSLISKTSLTSHAVYLQSVFKFNQLLSALRSVSCYCSQLFLCPHPPPGISRTR